MMSYNRAQYYEELIVVKGLKCCPHFCNKLCFYLAHHIGAWVLSDYFSILLLIGGDDQSEMSEFSLPTTGHSSMLPQADAREYQRSVLSLSDLRNTLGGSVTPSKELEAQRIRGNFEICSKLFSFLFPPPPPPSQIYPSPFNF